MGRDSSTQQPSSAAAHAVDRLNSWKEIAAYLKSSVRSVQRWERKECLPVHRHEHARVPTVYAYSADVDTWLAGRSDHGERREILLPGNAPPATRLIVLPFRFLQADAQLDFLSFGLADTIAASLSGLDSLSVRSSIVAARYAVENDLQRIAKETSVDLILVGTLLRSGDQLRVAVQMVDATSGSAVWSRTLTGSIGDIFQLQDRVAAGVVDGLALPVTARKQRLLNRDAPANAAAYEYFLRANELAHDFDPAARDLYARCLEEDPTYAPAWAHLGRCCRIIAKFGGDSENFRRADAALSRALQLRPDLALAHNQLAYLEADCNLADRAMTRLLSRAHPPSSDAELFAGLVHVCRYCGLLEASVAAHQRAIELDPTIRTSVCHTYFLLGDYHRALAASKEVLGYIGPLALICLGMEQEAVALGRRMERTSTPLPLVRCFFSSARALAEGDRAEALALSERAISLITRGPEELFQQARHLAYLAENERALAILSRAVCEGFYCYPALLRDPWFHGLRGSLEFRSILELASKRHQAAVRMFAESGGERLLGMAPQCAC